LGAKNITKLGSTALAAGDIVSGRVYQIEYDGTRFQLLNPSASSVASFSAGSTGFTPSSATTGAVTLAGTLATTNGGTGLTSFTSGGVVYASSSSALATGSALVFDGTNLGLGVTPSAWSASYKAIQLGGGTSIWSGASGNQPSFYSNNLYFNGSNRIYLQNGYATEYVQSTSGTHSWYTAPSGTAGNAITFTQAMTLDASGNLGIGTTSPATRLNVSSTGNGNRALFDDTTNDNTLGIYSDSTDIRLLSLNNSRGSYKRLGFQSNVMVFSASNGSESARIDTSGNLLVNSTSGSNHQIKKAVSVGSAVLEVIGNNVGCTFYNGDGGTPNAANAVLKVTSVGATGRSINAAGTVNAAGLDYAEYMTKSGDFTVAKGDVVGIDAQGKLTNVFANAVSFVVKSTNPSYVGGDTWGGDIEGDELEAARQTVDRIAFAGQVPVNVLGATAGQYIIPVNDNGAIKGQAVSNPTFEQYQSSVGKVIAIEADGRARIIVKVA